MIRKEVIIGDCRLILGDSLEVLPLLDPVDAVITSPPYGQQRDYGSAIGDWRALVSGALLTVRHHEATQVLVNLGLVHRDGEVVPYWQDMIDDMRAAGWRHFGWYVWDQGPGLPGDWNGRLAPSHEFVFHFNKKARKLNKIVPCTHAGKTRNTKVGLRVADGTVPSWSAEDLTTQDFRIGDSVVRTHRHKHVGGIEAGHPAVFPVAFPRELSSSFTNEGETVLDPFMGSGTTGVACAKLRRAFIGIELDEGYFNIACERIRRVYGQLDLFIDYRAPRAPEAVQQAFLLEAAE
jgi:DNA modification methylase